VWLGLEIRVPARQHDAKGLPLWNARQKRKAPKNTREENIKCQNI